MEYNHTISQSGEQKTCEHSLPKMKWYYFTIYFYLFLCAQMLLIMGVVILSYDNSQVMALFVAYKIFGALTICFSIYGIVVRQILARFKRCALGCLQIFYSYYTAIMLLTLISDIVIGNINGIALFFSVNFICLNAFVMIFSNFYFKKRKFLFTGSPATYNMLEFEADTIYRQNHPYIFGKYKGSDGWFAFLIYFWLFANAAVLLILGVFFTVLLYNGQINIITWIGNYFVSLSIVIIDYKLAIVLTVMFLLLAAFIVAVRFLLSSFKKAGVICLHCYFCINAVVATAQLIIMIVMSARVGENLVDFSTVVSWLYCIVVTIANFIYFKRRKEFFD